MCRRRGRSVAGHGGLGAQTYVQPAVDLRAEGNDNFDLIPGGSPEGDVYGFIVDLQALIGILHPAQRDVDPATPEVPGISGP